MEINLFWFRRDLRLEDNTALHQALEAGLPVLPIFIFDQNILSELTEDDARLTFIYDTLEKINAELTILGSSLLVLNGNPAEIWKNLIEEYRIKSVYCNRDYEPYALERDGEVEKYLESKGIAFHHFKDQVVFEKDEILKGDGTPYTIYTPYKNKWLERFQTKYEPAIPSTDFKNLHRVSFDFPSLESIGFTPSTIEVQPYNLDELANYSITRDFPSIDGTSYLGPHLRFGIVSPRQIIAKLTNHDAVFLSELVWREFFMQILYHFPRVIKNSFKPKYDGIEWRNDEKEFEKWCNGQTGYPMVDAGMRQLNATGYMHNRVRMVVASFLCKHLLIDWRWGEAYFAKKLLDFELSSNNGNWQWAAGTGCDSAPYFRVFNPSAQLQKFDKKLEYIRKWVPEYETFDYPKPMVDHKMARERALKTYKIGITVGQ